MHKLLESSAEIGTKVRKIVLRVACGIEGPPWTPDIPTGLKTSGWPTWVTCPACLTAMDDRTKWARS